MEILSIEQREKQANVVLTNDDVKAINATVKLYQDRHKDNKDDNIYTRLVDIEDKLHELFVVFNPS